MSVDRSNCYPEMSVVCEASGILSVIRLTNSSIYLMPLPLNARVLFRILLPAFRFFLMSPLRLLSPEFVILLPSNNVFGGSLCVMENCLTIVIILYLSLVVLYVVPHTCRSPIKSSCKGFIDSY